MIASVFERWANAPWMPSARTWLVGALMALMTLSLLMVASASIPFAMSRPNLYELKFFWSQLGYMVIALVAGLAVYQVSLGLLYRLESLIALAAIAFILMVATLVVGETINGSQRWLSVAGFSFQPSEMVKVILVLVVAEYIDRRGAEVRYHNIFKAGARILIWYVPFLTILFLQPDYGSVIVIAATMLVMFFVGGARFLQYLLLATTLAGLAMLGLWQADYRQTRLMSFIDPFDDVLNTDYQLSRSLVAFGRGEFSGVGYGNSIQKLEHLPEAHTDFLLAVTGEELGFLGVALVLILEFVVVAALMRISYKTLVRKQLKLCYTVFGFTVVIFGQVMINAGMNMGILPTKGLTMPFYSYGGSSMLVCVIMIALALKINQQSPHINEKQDSYAY